jgi:PhnB protein
MWTLSTCAAIYSHQAAFSIDLPKLFTKTTPNRREGDIMKVQPYLFFDGRCDEAIEFYRRALGAEVTMLMRYKDNPEPSQPGMVPPGSENKVMHSSFRIGDTVVMASDGRCLGQPDFKGFSLSLTVKSDAEADRLFDVLGNGGQVQMPIGKTFFSSRFGMVADRFGVSWMVIVGE